MKTTIKEMIIIKFALLAVFASLVLTASAQAATITVNSLSDTQANDGGCTLREAIINANANNQTGSTDCTAGAGADTINITTAGDISLLTALPNLTTGMTINGLGAANTTVRRDGAAATEFRIFTKTAGTSTISNLTVRDGIARGATGTFGGTIRGGGISNTGGQLTLTNVTVTNNQAIGGAGTSGQGGIGQGGGISNFATLILDNSTVSSNTAAGGAGTTSTGQGQGGGIHLDSGALTITNSVISSNTATGGSGFGGGIQASFGTSLSISGSTISGNSALSTNGANGGISNSSTPTTITDSTVSGNSGGGISNSSATMNIIRSTVSGNTNAANTGGITNLATMNITNSTVSGNSGVVGGISAAFGTLTIADSTVSNNSGTNTGGINVGNGTTTLNNTIIANSTSGGDCVRTGGTINATYSLIEQNLTCVNGTNTNNLTGDPNLGALANNGGATQTHALLPGSIAIDTGNSTLTTDQRGMMRPVDLATYPNAPGGNGSDIGAVELQLAPTAAGVSVGGRVLVGKGRGLTGALVYLTDASGNPRMTRTSTFGYYRFDDITAGQTVIVAVVSKRYQFAPQVVSVMGALDDLNFTADNIWLREEK